MRKCCLTDLLKDRKGLVGAELGVWGGDNAQGLFQFLNIKKLYLIDPYVPYVDLSEGPGFSGEGFEKQKALARERTAGYPAIWIEKNSWDAVNKFKDNSLDFVYIDANHGYDAVKQDITDWLPKVKKGGYLAGHDHGISDVARAIYDLEPYQTDGTEWWYLK